MSLYAMQLKGKEWWIEKGVRECGRDEFTMKSGEEWSKVGVGDSLAYDLSDKITWMGH